MWIMYVCFPPHSTPPLILESKIPPTMNSKEMPLWLKLIIVAIVLLTTFTFISWSMLDMLPQGERIVYGLFIGSIVYVCYLYLKDM